MNKAVYTALKERGHTDKQIQEMSLKKMCSEYTAWKIGDSYWGETIHDFIIEKQTPPATPTLEAIIAKIETEKPSAGGMQPACTRSDLKNEGKMEMADRIISIIREEGGI